MFQNFKIINLAKFLFWLSFILGNCCLLGFLISHETFFAIAGYFLLIGAGLLNFTAFIAFILYGIFNSKNAAEALKSALILLINIPIAALYAWIGLSII